MLNAPLRIMIVAGLCVLALFGLVLREGYERSRPSTLTSRDIQMDMQVIDPRALLSGHYVILNLQTVVVRPIGVEPCAHFAATEQNESWVALADLDADPRVPDRPFRPPHYTAVGTAATREAALAMANEAGPEGLAARGTAFCSVMPDQELGPGPASGATVQTQLRGVERFYAPQAEAERIEALIRDQSAETSVFAIVNIGRDGRARLKGLNVNGEIIELNWL